MVKTNVEIRKENVPYLRSTVCASWHGLSALLESWTHCYCLGFPRMEKDKNSSFHWRKNLPLLHILISTTALSLAQYRCLKNTERSTDIWGKSRDNIRSADHSELSRCFWVLPFFRSGYLYIYVTQLCLHFAVTHFFLYLCCFSINSFAHTYLLHLH